MALATLNLVSIISVTSSGVSGQPIYQSKKKLIPSTSEIFSRNHYKKFLPTIVLGLSKSLETVAMF